MKMKNFLKFKARENSTESRTTVIELPEEYHIKERTLWRPFRQGGLFCGFMALTVTITVIFNRNWIEGENFQSGVFQVCETNTSRGLDLAFTECTERDVYHRPYWQNAVIGLLIFSLGFGVLATVLSMCGVCSTALAKKIYYFHSAGEIFLICALAAVAALVTFPVGTELVLKLPDHSFGFGFGLGWGAAVFYLGASICMSVDDMVRQFSEKLPSWCPNCCKQCVPPPSSQLSTV